MRRLLFALVLSTTGCSLLGLSHIDLPECSSNDDCRALNVIFEVDEDCHPFYCQDGRCMRYAEGVESNDRLDNDCDGVIDEPSLEPSSGPRQTIVSDEVIEVGSVESDTAVDVAFGADDEGNATALWFDNEERQAWYAPILGDAVEAVALEYARNKVEPVEEPEGPVIPPMTNIEIVAGCYRRDGDAVVEDQCDFAEVALDRLGPRSMVAAVDSSDCEDGLLRIGYTDADDEHDEWEVILRGPLRRSNSYLGIDDTDEGCTGASRPGCEGRGPPCGVARPSVAIMERDPLQALVGWIGSSRQRDLCGDVEAPVEVVAAFLMTDRIGEDYAWITASGEAVPQAIGRTTGGGPPAIAAWEDAGFLVAFGDQAGRLALRYVPAGEDPPESDWSCETCDASDRTGLSTLPLPDPVELGELGAAFGGPVDHVTIAIGTTRNDEVEVGVAWTEGCGSGDEVIVFRKIVLRAAGRELTAIADEGQSERLSARLGESSGRLGPQSLIYLPGGFLVPGFERNGLAVSEESDGGWLVAWAERAETGAPGRLLARRVAELDGCPLDEGELVDLTVPGSEASSDARAPALYLEGRDLRYAYHDRARGEVVGGRVRGMW